MTAIPSRFRYLQPRWGLAVAVVTLLLSCAWATPAFAVSLRDLVELSRAGVGDEVLVALIDIEPGPFQVSAEQVLQLRAAGLSDRVIARLIRHKQPVQAAAAPDGTAVAVEPPDAGTVVVPGQPPAPAPGLTVQVQNVVMPASVPVFVPVFVGGHSGPARAAAASAAPPPYQGVGRFINDGSQRFLNTGFVGPGTLTVPPAAGPGQVAGRIPRRTP
jgi:hypothetical protein